MTRHRLIDPEGMPEPSGFSYAAVPATGRTVYLAGLTGHHADGSIDDDLVAQFEAACGSVARVIAEAGGEPDDLVSMTIYTTEVGLYRESLGPIGAAYRSVFGGHYPPMSLFGVSDLFDPRAMVELVCVAVVPE